MYSVSTEVLDRLKAVFTLFRRIEDVLTIFETSEGLEFIAANSSGTVTFRAVLNRQLFACTSTSSGVYRLSSSLLERIFNSIPQDSSEISFAFGETLVVNVVYKNVYRTHSVELLEPDETAERRPGSAYIRGENGFKLRIEMLRQVLAYFSTAAEMAELRLESDGAARWRGYRNPKRAGKQNIFTKIDSMALLHYSDMFEQGVRVRAPWRSEFRLKELRFACAFLEKVNNSGSVTCLFDAPGSPLHFYVDSQQETYVMSFQTVSKPLSGDPVEINHAQVPYEVQILRSSTPLTQSPPDDSMQVKSIQVESLAREESLFVDDDDVHDDEEEWAMLDPMAEIQETQTERVRGLFD